jgi:hypothetical protein
MKGKSVSRDGATVRRQAKNNGPVSDKKQEVLWFEDSRCVVAALREAE